MLCNAELLQKREVDDHDQKFDGDFRNLLLCGHRMGGSRRHRSR
jgi:hypothetical protein